MIAAAHRSAALAACCLLAGCAAAGPAVLPQAAVSAAATPVAGAGAGDYGVIVAERPLRPRRAGDVRGTILAVLGDAAVRPLPGQPAGFEFIVREADGATLSVVQDNPQHLRPGERVTIRHAPRTMLAAASAPATASAP